jgi:DNA polymerase I-like protein with 3'-5' exonuclease and polymerase domains
LSGDTALLEAFNSDDLYLELARRMGVVPKDAKRHQSPEIELMRQCFKAVVLGLSYGMGAHSLAGAVYAEVNRKSKIMTFEDAKERADAIYAWHKAAFRRYWEFLQGRADVTRRTGIAKSLDNWLYFADMQTPQTRLLNFPMQSNGAVMLRRAMMSLAQETDIGITCSLHDALYALCDVADEPRYRATILAHMERAAQSVVGTKVKIMVEAKSLWPGEHYHDVRGKNVLKLVQEKMDELEANPVDLLVVQEPKRKPQKKPAPPWPRVDVVTEDPPSRAPWR